ncbi:hypothetical protein UCRPC4_g06685 [Phaeomoniella chlamydospora]|uniref:ML-like domain-containing protein n=1 Tax=Phaeomoniella chlamydospora TaxID=158046 RepID=A0A0G2FRP1_PHACM|nr:hypothetical protein UCRPC4_g06685 [Phaeomoniella chlamydospora]
MRVPWSTSLIAAFVTFCTFSPVANATRLIESKSLTSCQENSNFTASLFDVVFTPDNNTLAFEIVGVSSIQGNVTAVLEVIAYGYTALKETLDPCEMDLSGLCPMSTGQINIESNIEVSDSVIENIPGIAYTVPDLDGVVRIYINSTDTGKSVACVEAELSNGKTVNQKAVGWVTAVIAGMGLAASAVTSGLGHSNTAAHVAANALSLFGFFQAQAFIGMTAVDMPPIVQSWTQDFQWSMGIIRVGFLQDICTWYQRATGGTPATLLSSLSTTSVDVQKRSLEMMKRSSEHIKRWVIKTGGYLIKRSNSDSTSSSSDSVVVVRGIERVGFRASIESTNIFLTGMIFFLVFCAVVAILVVMFKGICELCAKKGLMKGDKFSDFRNGWKIVLKGILFRLILIGFPQMCVLCLWELTVRDSSAEVILAVVVFLAMFAALGWASFKVIRLARRSVAMHKNPAYMLYSDPTCLNKWGFLYVQYRATAYYFILPTLGYILLKAMFIAFGQGAYVVQAVALVIIEGCMLVAVSVLRPWMDKKTNVFNISIAAINFLNAIFLLVFTSVFGQPGIVTGVMGVVFFVYNAVFALVLLLLVLIASGYAIFSRNPDTRYQPMRDDRGSFIKSQSNLHTTELDALGATARGDTKETYGNSRLGDDDDDDSFSSHSQNKEAAGVTVPTSTASTAYRDVPDNTSRTAMIPDRRPAPPSYDQRGMYAQPNPSSVSAFSGYQNQNRSQAASPAPYAQNQYGNYNSGATNNGLYSLNLDNQIPALLGKGEPGMTID